MAYNEEMPEVRVWSKVSGVTWQLEAIITAFDSIQFKPTFNQPGDWEATLPYDEVSRPLAEPSSLVTIDYRRQRSTWRLGTINPSRTAGEETKLTVGGSGALSLLADEVARPDPSKGIHNQNDELPVLYEGSAGLVIRQIILANYPSTEHDIFISAAVDFGEAIRARARFDNLMELVVKKANVAGIGVDVGLVSTSGTRARLEARIWQPRNMTAEVYLSERVGSLQEWSNTNTAPTVTKAIVAGAGTGVDRLYEIVTTPQSEAAAAEWGGHRTAFVSGPTSYDVPDLVQAGKEALKEGAATVNVSLSAVDAEGLVAFRDYQVGDRVTGELETGLVVKDIVSSMAVSAGDGYPDVTPTFGDPNADDPMVSFAEMVRAQNRRIRAVEQLGAGSGASGADITAP